MQAERKRLTASAEACKDELALALVNRDFQKAQNLIKSRKMSSLALEMAIALGFTEDAIQMAVLNCDITPECLRLAIVGGHIEFAIEILPMVPEITHDCIVAASNSTSYWLKRAIREHTRATQV